MKEQGHVLSVAIERLGDDLDAAATTGATTLVVGDVADFDELGGSLWINGDVLLYSTVDDDAGTITLVDPLPVDADINDAVYVWDTRLEQIVVEHVAMVEVDGDYEGDAIEAVIAHHLINDLPTGIRGLDGESVLIEEEDDAWRLIDVLGSGGPTTVGVQFMQDSTTVTEVGDQIVELTHVPITNSEHLYWNGLYQPGTEWTRDGQTVSVPDPGEVCAVDDVLTVEYAYREAGVAPSGSSVPVTLRYYFPSLAMALPGPIVPPYGEMWTVLDEDEYTYRSILNPSPLGVTDLLPAIMPEAMATPVDILRGQFIAEETLGAGTISGSMRMAMVIGTSNTDANSHLACRIYVVSNDGMTERCELFVGTASPESTTSAQTRKIEGLLTPGVVQDGDRIVVEIGAAHLDAIAALYYSSLTVGEGNSGIDLPFETDGGDASLRPWIELNLTWDA